MSKAIMTIHGFLTEVKDFQRLYDYLDYYDEVKAVEIPGHNGEVDFSLFTVEGTQQTVLDAYDELRARHDQVDVVGFSMGGALATWLCCLRDVHKAVLIAPSNKFFNVALPFDAVKFYGGLHVKHYREADGSVRDKFKNVEQRYQPYADNIKTSFQILIDRTAKYISPHTYSVFTQLMKLANKQIESVSPVETPALVLWGRLDELVPFRSVRFVMDHFVNAKCTVYPDVGHAMLYTNRDNVIIHDVVAYLSDGEVDLDVPYRDV